MQDNYGYDWRKGDPPADWDLQLWLTEDNEWAPACYWEIQGWYRYWIWYLESQVESSVALWHNAYVFKTDPTISDFFTLNWRFCVQRDLNNERTVSLIFSANEQRTLVSKLRLRFTDHNTFAAICDSTYNPETNEWSDALCSEEHVFPDVSFRINYGAEVVWMDVHATYWNGYVYSSLQIMQSNADNALPQLPCAVIRSTTAVPNHGPYLGIGVDAGVGDFRLWSITGEGIKDNCDPGEENCTIYSYQQTKDQYGSTIRAPLDENDWIMAGGVQISPSVPANFVFSGGTGVVLSRNPVTGPRTGTSHGVIGSAIWGNQAQWSSIPKDTRWGLIVGADENAANYYALTCRKIDATDPQWVGAGEPFIYEVLQMSTVTPINTETLTRPTEPADQTGTTVTGPTTTLISDTPILWKQETVTVTENMTVNGDGTTTIETITERVIETREALTSALYQYPMIGGAKFEMQSDEGRVLGDVTLSPYYQYGTTHYGDIGLDPANASGRYWGMFGQCTDPATFPIYAMFSSAYQCEETLNPWNDEPTECGKLEPHLTCEFVQDVVPDEMIIELSNFVSPGITGTSEDPNNPGTIVPVSCDGGCDDVNGSYYVGPGRYSQGCRGEELRYQYWQWPGFGPQVEWRRYDQYREGWWTYYEWMQCINSGGEGQWSLIKTGYMTLNWSLNKGIATGEDPVQPGYLTKIVNPIVFEHVGQIALIVEVILHGVSNFQMKSGEYYFDAMGGRTGPGWWWNRYGYDEHHVFVKLIEEMPPIKLVPWELTYYGYRLTGSKNDIYGSFNEENSDGSDPEYATSFLDGINYGAEFSCNMNAIYFSHNIEAAVMSQEPACRVIPVLLP